MAYSMYSKPANNSQSLAGSGDAQGCVHYRRNCKVLCPCCDKIYSCRLCHDESEKHMVVRQFIKEVICNFCSTRQKPTKQCNFCGVVFGNYFCEPCRLYDNDQGKMQFHCQGCGICRTGGAQNFFHCKTCNLCLNVAIRDTHKCVENASRTDCPVCTEDLHTSRKPCSVPVCGHLIHPECLDQLTEKGMKECPICKKPLELLPFGDSMSAMSGYRSAASYGMGSGQSGAGSSGAGDWANRVVSLKCQCCERTSSGVARGANCVYCGSSKIYPADE